MSLTNIVHILAVLIYTLCLTAYSNAQDCPTDYNNVPYGLTTNPTAPILKGNLAPGQIRRFGHHPNWFKWDVPQGKNDTHWYWGAQQKVNTIIAPWFNGNDLPARLREREEYGTEHGWELITADLGISYDSVGTPLYQSDVIYPYVVIYNKYRGIMRVYWFIPDITQPDIARIYTYTEERFDMTRNSRVPNLFHSTTEQSSNIALDKLPFGVAQDGEQILKFTPTNMVELPYPRQYRFSSITDIKWLYADFPVQYDPCVCMNPSSIVFHSQLINIDTVDTGILTDVNRKSTKSVFTPGSLNSSKLPSDREIFRYLLPYYNNPLGVFNLLRTPKAVIEKKYRGKENCSKEFDWSGLMKTCNFTWDEVIQHRVKLVSPIDYVVNPSAGLDVEDVSGELVLEYDSAKSAGEWYNAESRISQNSNTVREGSATWKTTRMPLGCLPYSHVDAHAIRRGMHSVIQHNPWQSNPCNKYSCEDISYYQHPTLKSISVRIFVKYKEKNAPYRTFVQSYLYPVEYTDATDTVQFTTVDASCAIPNPPKDAVTVRAFCESNSDNGYKPAEREFIPNNVTIARTKDGKKILPSYPNIFTISNVYPNPFSTQTTFSYTVSVQGRVVITVYDALGAKVSVLVDESDHSRGTFTKTFDGSNIAPGTYYVVLQSGEVFESTPMMVIR